LKWLGRKMGRNPSVTRRCGNSLNNKYEIYRG